MNEHEELARLLFITDNFNAANPAYEWKIANDLPISFTANYYRLADAVLGAGYKREGGAA